MALDDIDTIVFVMLENRSFDHMLGYLSLDETADKLPVDGLRSDERWRSQFTNLANGKEYSIKKIGEEKKAWQVSGGDSELFTVLQADMIDELEDGSAYRASSFRDWIQAEPRMLRQA